MANVVKTGWFSRRITVLMVTGKSVTGTLDEVTDNYIVLTRDGSEVQVMCHAIVAIRLAEDRGEGE